MDMARGGGGGGEDETSDDVYDDDDDNNASDNDETDVEDNTDENEDVIDKTMESSIIGGDTSDNAVSSSSNNFGLVVALWSSLVFDTILNKSKRLALFPTTTLSSTITSTITTTSLLATAQLSSGFALAVGVSFLLWRDMENRVVESSSGDSFLSLSSSSDGVSSINKEEEDTTVLATRIRVRLLLHLTVFGILCLTGQSMGYYFSNQAPFLGLSAAAVNIHNVLLCISTLMKEVKQEGSETTTSNNIQQLYKSNSSKDGRRRNIAQWTQFLFRLGTVAAYVRCLVVGKYIIALTLGLLSSVSVAGGVGIASSTATVSNARLLSLQLPPLLG
jgi:hypothetical protein